jgi:hypothetical protein
MSMTAPMVWTMVPVAVVDMVGTNLGKGNGDE